MYIILASNIHSSTHRGYVTFTVKDKILVSKKVIHLKDIVDTNNYIIKDIDIAEFKDGQRLISISKKHILYRLMLYDNYCQYSIIGPENISVYYVHNEDQKIVMAGNKVTLTYKSGGIVLKTMAELVEPGKIGSTVKVRVIDSVKYVQARLYDEYNAIYE